MKKKIFAAALAACMFCASVSPQALLRQTQSPQPTQASTAQGASQTYPNPAKPEPARFVSVNSQYRNSADTLYLSFTNNEVFPVTLTGEGYLEVEAKVKQYLRMPRHDTNRASSLESGIFVDALDKPIAPGETMLFEMFVGHYQPVPIAGSAQFPEGLYRVSVEVLRQDGATYEWACTPFRIVAGQVQADQDNVAVSVARSSYSPRTTTIRYTIENRTEGSIWYDDSAKLQRLAGTSNWTDVVGSAQESGELRQLSAKASDAGQMEIPDGLSPGTYRVVKTVAGLELASGQFTVPGSDALRFSLTPVQISVDWYAIAQDKRVKGDWWTRTKTSRDLWLTEENLYDGEIAPTGILRELEAFQSAEEPVGYSRDTLVEVTLWDASQRNVTASLLATSSATYCLVGDKWYKTGDIHVLDRIKTAIEAVSDV